MRKFIMVLACAIAPFMFSSCEEAEGLVGSMTITVGEQTYNIPDALFYGDTKATYVAGSNFSESIGIRFEGFWPGTYTLGLGENILSAAGNISEITNMKNTLIYIPSSGIETDGLTAVCGTLNITEYATNSLKGEFRGYALRSELISSGDIDWSSIENNLQEFSGSFEAVGRK